MPKILKDYETKIKLKPVCLDSCELYLLIKLDEYRIVLSLPIEIAGDYFNMEIRCMDLEIKMNLENCNYITIDSYRSILSQTIYDIYHDKFDD